MSTAQPRGIRNNNPLNIVHVTANKWQGLANPPSDGRFCRFVAPQYGIRAAAMILIGYQDLHGLRTIDRIIRRFAPAIENDVDSYIADVAKRSGFAPKMRLDLQSYDHLRPILEAMAWHENGVQPFSPAVWDEGLLMAGVVSTSKNTASAERPAPSSVPKAATKDKAVIVPTIIGTATAAAQVTAQVESIWLSLARINPWAPHIVMGALGLIAAAAAAVFVIDWLKARRAARAA